jgi:hypothetical protein
MPTDTLDSTFAALADPTRRGDPGAPRFEGRGVRQSRNTEPPEQELLITRVIDAPRQLVFEAWTEPEHFVRWWGPKEREFANRGARESAGVSKRRVGVKEID